MKKPQRASVRIAEKGIKKYAEGLPVIKRRRIESILKKKKKQYMGVGKESVQY